MTPHEILVKARELISDPARWTQKMAAKDVFGRSVSCDDRAAICWCPLAAVARVSDNAQARDEAREVLMRICGNYVSTFNDTHTHPEVLGMFDRAIEATRP